MRHRSTRDILDDHLRRRAAGDLDGDLLANYAPDVIVLHPDGEAFGHDGVRWVADRLSRYQSDSEFRCHRVLTSGEIGVLEWSGRGGRTDTMTIEATESFVMREGLIAAQTLTYVTAYTATAA
ncbi:nuclear transport factor 2 family protein [Virgisporangium aurantiacum]|uniref:SnoaL-like domain-containing protein n=1 Tax=Virgisporangium aurantiacum TaxID=175570 RepID=A0A8J4E431_9ACTN|nr:nuclear transport factor 2 family protein [Virgisporangium aurantiacum]GIJ61540.1 hypothetical protein Vau01_090560 [Virgisporangium aurantiacum]